MKVALLTIWHEKNYGAELQAYATIRLLEKLGHSVEMINIHLSDAHKLNAKGTIIRMIETLSPCERKFNSFWKKYIPVTKRFRTEEELINNPPDADIYIVGSDQVWNPQITKSFSKLFFLNFGSDEITRISLASSFGTENWMCDDESLTADIKKLLERFSSISCREDSGVRILSNKFGLEATQVLDPTLLLDSYDLLINVTGHSAKKKLAYYPLSGGDDELTQFAVKMAKKQCLIPININQQKRILGKIVWNRPSISEWVTSIYESEFIITRSFHGIAFAIIFQKQFAVLVGRNNRTTRLVSLLKLFNLENRLFNNVSDMEQILPTLPAIDFNNVSKKLELYRKQSLSYISSILQ